MTDLDDFIILCVFRSGYDTLEIALNAFGSLSEARRREHEIYTALHRAREAERQGRAA